ncbi:AfsR/SARP family transcriptional regulator [Micromonospora citrea]|uniref:AfsR/SARP family transcriptional regulator n=1 Tax=Micromonospora citrea TaxID=47855 RepID=UPI000B8936EB|nr:AfsR/SARP family transcriptional regulator [Micromonospora citrea]
MAVEFGLLGDFRAYIDDQPVDVGHIRQQSVLAPLPVDANRTVPVEHLMDRAWGERRPSRPLATLYSCLSRLRGCLAPSAEVLINRQAGGCLLAVAPDPVDLHRFTRLTALARRTSDSEQALRLFEESLRLWRGTPLAHIDTPWAAGLRETSQRDRIAADRDRIDPALRHGQHAELVPHLTTCVEQQPFDERLVGQLMLALGHSGRRADALHQFDELRRRLDIACGLGWIRHQRGDWAQALDPQPAGTTALPGDQPPPRAGDGVERPRVIALRARRSPGSAHVLRAGRRVQPGDRRRARRGGSVGQPRPRPPLSRRVRTGRSRDVRRCSIAGGRLP